MSERVCENPGCGYSFLPKRPEQRFCCVGCRNAVTARQSAAKRGDAMRGKRRRGSSAYGGGRYPKLMQRPAHQAVAEQALGRPLRPGEVVHHLNGDKSDFRPSNVIVLSSQSAHARLQKKRPTA